jgi:hypothetical protein
MVAVSPNADLAALAAALRALGTAADHPATDFASGVADAGAKTANYTATAGQIVRCDASGGTFTVTLPNAPSDGVRVIVKKIDTSGNGVTITCAGSDVLNVSGGSTSTALCCAFQSLTFQYVASGAIWVIVAADSGRTNWMLPAISTQLSAGTVATGPSIPVAGYSISSSYDMELSGDIDTTAGGGNFSIKLQVNGTQIVSVPIVVSQTAATNNMRWYIKGRLYVDTLGSSGVCSFYGTAIEITAVGGTISPRTVQGSATVNIATNLQLTAQGNIATTNATNIIRVYHGSMNLAA